MTASHLLADLAIRRLLTVLPAARLVGGCVRDALAGRPAADIDLATPQPPDAVVAALAAAGIRAIPTGIAHGTVTALLDGRPFEITTLRRDVLTDGRHAAVAWTTNWQEDAARRDFTINALSLDAAGMLHDYFGGIADLRRSRVRFVGDATARVAEDYLRILRFFRFQARYGAGPPDPEAVSAITAGIGGIARLSPERVWSELKRILAAPDPAAALQLMAETGVLAAAVPEGAAPGRVAALPPDPVLRTAALLTGDRAAFAARLRLSGAEAERLLALAGPPPHGDDDDLRRQLADTDPDILVGRSLLAGQEPAMRDRLGAIPAPRLPAGGPRRAGGRRAARPGCRRAAARGAGLVACRGLPAHARCMPGRTGEAGGGLIQAAAMDASTPRALLAEPRTHALLGRLWREHLRRHRGRLAVIFVLTAAMAGLTALYPVVIDRAFSMFANRDVRILYQVPALVVVITAAKAATTYAQTVMTQSLVLRAIRELQGRMFAHLTNADLARVERESPAQLAARFTTDATIIREALTRAVGGVANAITVAGLIASMLWLDWVLSLIAACLYPLAALPIQRIGKRIRRVSGGMQEQMGETASILTESFSQARTVRAYRLEAAESARATTAFAALNRALLRMTRSRSAVDPLLEVLGGAAVAAVMGFRRLARGGRHQHDRQFHRLRRRTC